MFIQVLKVEKSKFVAWHLGWSLTLPSCEERRMLKENESVPPQAPDPIPKRGSLDSQSPWEAPFPLIILTLVSPELR